MNRVDSCCIEKSTAMCIADSIEVDLSKAVMERFSFDANRCKKQRSFCIDDILMLFDGRSYLDQKIVTDVAERIVGSDCPSYKDLLLIKAVGRYQYAIDLILSEDLAGGVFWVSKATKLLMVFYRFSNPYRMRDNGSLGGKGKSKKNRFVKDRARSILLSHPNRENWKRKAEAARDIAEELVESNEYKESSLIANNSVGLVESWLGKADVLGRDFDSIFEIRSILKE